MSLVPAPSHEPCCEKSLVCRWCERGKHHVCSGCHGCGCVISAQRAAKAHGFPLAGKKP